MDYNYRVIFTNNNGAKVGIYSEDMNKINEFIAKTRLDPEFAEGVATYVITDLTTDPTILAEKAKQEAKELAYSDLKKIDDISKIKDNEIKEIILKILSVL